MTPPTVTCLDCHRALTDPVSQVAKRGPDCRKRAGIVVIVVRTPAGQHRGSGDRVTVPDGQLTLTLPGTDEHTEPTGDLPDCPWPRADTGKRVGRARGR